MNLIELKHFSFKYNILLFEDLNFIILHDSFMCIAGCNNSGKTTLLKIIDGQIKSNDIIYNNDIFNDENKKKLIKYIDKITIFYSKTIFDELSLLTEDVYLIKSLLDKFGLLNKINISPNNLCVEEMIILNIIKALIEKPKLLLLDNIFSCFNINKKSEFIKKLKTHCYKNEIAVVLVTNNINDSIYFENFLIINNKKISKDISGSNLCVPFTFELSEKLLLYNLITEEEYNVEKLVEKLC